MGYHTDFEGGFGVTPPLTEQQIAYLNKFNETRRVNRDAKITATRPDPEREAVKLPVGEGGCYFVGETGFMGQDDGPDVLTHNDPPTGQPGLWCQWVPTEDGESIVWDGGEKFYNYIEWLQYIINHFMKRWGRTLNGEVLWYGEERGDLGAIVVNDNVMTVKEGYVTYGDGITLD